MTWTLSNAISVGLRTIQCWENSMWEIKLHHCWITHNLQTTFNKGQAKSLHQLDPAKFH